jgi:hypothetical protein
MPREDNTLTLTRASIKRTQLAKKLGLPVPNEAWGPFRPLRAMAVVESRLKGHAQHLAWAIARRTPHDGVIFLVHKEIADITGRPVNAIGDALQEAIDAGLMHGRRTIGGFCYTWAEAAYVGASVGANGENRCFDAVSVDGELRALESVTLAA